MWDSGCGGGTVRSSNEPSRSSPVLAACRAASRVS